MVLEPVLPRETKARPKVKTRITMLVWCYVNAYMMIERGKVEAIIMLVNAGLTLILCKVDPRVILGWCYYDAWLIQGVLAGFLPGRGNLSPAADKAGKPGA